MRLASTIDNTKELQTVTLYYVVCSKDGHEQMFFHYLNGQWVTISVQDVQPLIVYYRIMETTVL